MKCTRTANWRIASCLGGPIASRRSKHAELFDPAVAEKNLTASLILPPNEARLVRAHQPDPPPPPPPPPDEPPPPEPPSEPGGLEADEMVCARALPSSWLKATG